MMRITVSNHELPGWAAAVQAVSAQLPRAAHYVLVKWVWLHRHEKSGVLHVNEGAGFYPG